MGWIFPVTAHVLYNEMMIFYETLGYFFLVGLICFITIHYLRTKDEQALHKM